MQTKSTAEKQGPMEPVISHIPPKSKSQDVENKSFSQHFFIKAIWLPAQGVKVLGYESANKHIHKKNILTVLPRITVLIIHIQSMLTEHCTTLPTCERH